MRLNELRDNIGATRARTRVGRGKGSGKGKTCGHGYKGQKARSGVAIDGFEGGQMPLHIRLPKRGFNPHKKIEHAVVNVGRLQEAIDAKKLNENVDVTVDVLHAAGLIRDTKSPVRLLAKGNLRSKLNISVHHSSKKAEELVKHAGGSVTIIGVSQANKT